MDYILSSHPLSTTFRRELKERIDGEVSYLSMTELKSLSPLKIFRKLRSFNIDTLYLAFEEDSSLSIKSTMEIIALISGAKQVFFIQPNFNAERVSKLGTLFQIFQFFVSNLRARYIFGKSQRMLDRLIQRERIRVDKVSGHEILYLKTNLWYGAKAGGSVGHVAGVINGFFKKHWNITFASIEPPIMAEEHVDFLEVPFPQQLAYPPDLNNYVYSKEMYDSIRRVAKHRNFDVIYQRMSINNFSGVLLSRALGVPLILEYNGSEVWISRNWGRPLVFEKQALLCEDVCLKHAHVIVTVSDVLRDELIARGVEPSKIVTYPNCVDPETFRPSEKGGAESLTFKRQLGFQDDDILATFVGTFGKWHGVELLARSIRHLVDDERDWLDRSSLKFVMVGDGFLMPEVKELVGCPPYSEYVKLTGLVPQKEAPRYLNISDILLSPHVPNADGSRFFGSPTKLFEYMSMGKAIIASDLEQLGDVLGNSISMKEIKAKTPLEDGSSAMALLTRAGDQAELVAAVQFLVDQPQWRPVLGANARQEALDKYTWLHHVDAILQRMYETPTAEGVKRRESLIHSFFANRMQWAHRVIKNTFLRKVIDRLSIKLLVPAIGHKELVVQSRRGLQYNLKYPEDIGWESIIVFSDYETGTSDLFESLLDEGDSVYDVGANLGWYTTLAAKAVGKSGRVDAFEPVPKIYEKLKKNCELNNGISDQICIHNEAISDEQKDFDLFSYEGLPHGLTSAKALYGNTHRVKKTKVHATTLDRVWEASGCPPVKLVKVDVEGLEYNVLLGSKKLIEKEGPLWLVEINYQTSEAFNWSPDQLLGLLKNYNDYQFMRINEAWGLVEPLKEVSELRNGDVVLAHIPGKHEIPI